MIVFYLFAFAFIFLIVFVTNFAKRGFFNAVVYSFFIAIVWPISLAIFILRKFFIKSA